MKSLKSLLPVIALFVVFSGYSQPAPLWHNQQRVIHYVPEGNAFKKATGTRRFNRALYGGNSGFRVEAGDLPEFGLYLPGMGGNIKFGLISGDKSKWIINADSIETWYQPGSMKYVIRDSLLKDGMISIVAIALYDTEGLVVKVEWNKVPSEIQLLVAYGGATGTRFSREGDIGADPESSFYLKPEYCRNNAYRIRGNVFTLFYGSKALTEEDRYEIQHVPTKTKDTTNQNVSQKVIGGIFPDKITLHISDASFQDSPLQFLKATASPTPALCGTIELDSDLSAYFMITNGPVDSVVRESEAYSSYWMAEANRKKLAERIIVNTPDPYINTIGGALSIAGDAIWENPSYMHGAVAWRMRLNGWRGAYVADVFGWHDRARTHFNSYALSQLTSAPGLVVMDTALHLARSLEKLGVSLYNDGYISRNPNGDFRPHHYDMNLVFVDQLLNHFQWMGDTGYIKRMWPLLTRHLAWEKRNFDSDGDGLYDAYAAIWASDAMQYSGGGVAHTSAYNYRGNLMAAELARLIGKDPLPYEQEAKKILKAMNQELWLNEKGTYAEYKDLLGNRLNHPVPGLWTIYHSIDSKVPDPFQSYQLLRYVDTEIPHIPIRAAGLSDTSLYTISTTNWQPYDWSLNNVVLGEVMHTALAYWQGGRPDEAYKLWKGSLVESMYLGASPGNMQQLSFYDAIRGELYRDFADDIGMAARSLVEGLFGIQPDALKDTLYLNPGFPADWKYASINTPDINFAFAYKNTTTVYDISPRFLKKMSLVIRTRAPQDFLESVLVNGKRTNWTIEKNAIGFPVVKVSLPPIDNSYHIEMHWKGSPVPAFLKPANMIAGQPFNVTIGSGQAGKVYDPQKILKTVTRSYNQITGTVNDQTGQKTFFVEVKQGNLNYWLPVLVNTGKTVDISSTDKNILIGNSSAAPIKGRLFLNNNYRGQLLIQPGRTEAIFKSSEIAGTNTILFQTPESVITSNYTDWERSNPATVKYEKIDISGYFNDQVTSIFKNQYLSPRPKGPTLQLPTQGIGNWAYPLVTAVINDSGLRKRAEGNNEIVIRQGIPFAIDPAAGKKNIVFTSQWDNFPDSLFIPLKGKAAHAYLLMAGTTNPMQSRMVNGEVIIHYKDGTTDKLELKNPETWWPIEQDYYEDGYAFTTGPKPVRVYLKSGEDTRTFNNFTTIRGFSNRAIDGGAATVLDLPLNPGKVLDHLELKAIANDVIIGLMSLTLVRN